MGVLHLLDQLPASSCFVHHLPEMHVERLRTTRKFPLNTFDLSTSDCKEACQMFNSVNFIDICPTFRYCKKRSTKRLPKGPNNLQHNQIPAIIHQDLIRVGLAVSTLLRPIIVTLLQVANFSPLKSTTTMIAELKETAPRLPIHPLWHKQLMSFLLSHLCC